MARAWPSRRWSGYAVIAGLLAWLRRQPLTVFVVYRVILGLVLLATFVVRV